MNQYIKKVFNKNTSYSFKEALVHKICNISRLFPKTYDVNIDGMMLIIKMEKLKPKLTGSKTKAWLDILQAVALLNYFGIAHRDIKSDNIMYRNGTQAVLIDFGLSKYLIGESHTPKIVSEFYRAPELDINKDTQNYGMEIDSWALGIWALELYHKLFNINDFLIEWKEDQHAYYLDKLPLSIKHIVDSFLKPQSSRKTALDWIQIDNTQRLFRVPDDYNVPVPQTVEKYGWGYRAILWNLDEYNWSSNEKQIVAIWMTSVLFMLTPLSLRSLCKSFKIDANRIYDFALEWFVNLKLQ